MPKVKPGTLTPKQAKYVEGYVSGKPGYIAAMEAYDTTDKNVANQISIENLQKPTLKDIIDKAMAKHSVTADDIAFVTRKALDYQGVTERDSLEMNLKGADRAMRMLQMTEDKATSGGNTLIFNDNRKTSKYVKGDE